MTSPHVIPRQPPRLVPPALDTPVPEKISPGSNDGWPTSLLTIEVPVYQPRGTPARARRAPAMQIAERPLALTGLAGGLALVSLAIAFWQLYWLLDATDRGRALLDAAGAVFGWAADLF